jgi:hypothetical protein
MAGIALLPIILLYALAGWWIGRVWRRNWAIRTELAKVRRELKPGFQLAPSWYAARQKSMWLIVIFGLAGILIPLAVAVWTYSADFRSFHIFMAALTTVAPIWLGWMGVVPIPGIDIET